MSFKGSDEKIDPGLIVFAQKEHGSSFWNARQFLDPNEMSELFEDIKRKGLIEQVVVRKLDSGRFAGKYQVVCGERRTRNILKMLQYDAKCYDLRTGTIASAQQVYNPFPCRVLYNCSDEDASSLSISENIKRKNLSEFELMAYTRDLENLRDDNGEPVYSRKQICEIIHKSAPWVSQTLSLWELPEKIIQMLKTQALPRTVALGLLKVDDDPEKICRVLEAAHCLAEEETKEAVDRLKREISGLESQRNQVEIELAAAQVIGVDDDVAKTAKSEINKKLGDAKNRLHTATSRTARITDDTLQRAMEQVPNSRKGKHSGLTPKVVRALLADTMHHVEKNCEGNVINYKGAAYSKREVEILLLGFRMVLGEITERDVFRVLGSFDKPPTMSAA